MNTFHSAVAGVDVHKDVLAITALVGEPVGHPAMTQFLCKTFTEDLMKAGATLLALGVTEVAMESTGVYWRPVYNVWAVMGIRITLANAYHLRNVPGRKTDMNDSEWIAWLHRSGLIRGSYIPEEEFLELRALNRHRTNLVEDRSRVKNRILKVLEDGNIKLASIVSDPFGVAGTKIMKAIANGNLDTQSILEEAKIGPKKWEEFRKSLVHCLRSQHRFLLAELLIQLMHIDERVISVDKELATKTEKHADLLSRLEEIPGVSKVLAQGILAEATTKMNQFKDERTFAAWAGVAPGNNESAGKKKRAGTRKGNPALKKILIQAANGAVKKSGSYYEAKANSLTLKTGSRNKAKVAIANRIARAVYHIIAIPGERFKDIGPQRAQSESRQIKSLVNKLKQHGAIVEYNPITKVVSVKKTFEVKF